MRRATAKEARALLETVTRHKAVRRFAQRPEQSFEIQVWEDRGLDETHAVLALVAEHCTAGVHCKVKVADASGRAFPILEEVELHDNRHGVQGNDAKLDAFLRQVAHRLTTIYVNASIIEQRV